MIQLIPPVGTDSFSKETIKVFDNDEYYWNDKDAGKITWIVDVYKYASGAAPEDPNFPQKGEIILVFVHSGTVHLGDVYYERQFSVTVSDDHSKATKQDPTHGTRSGDVFEHTIDFKETFAMIQNHSREFPFEAIFQDSFPRGDHAQQTGEIIRAGKEAAFAVSYWKNPSHPERMSFPIKGLSVFKSSDPSKFPIKFTFAKGIRYFDGKNETFTSSVNHVNIGLGFPSKSTLEENAE
ncbi:hypothetical protein ONZ45_g8168 [Pleurotus djamor]|nr:hypothetical protein ONZ45_g8168 [Pleurotus djamor]